MEDLLVQICNAARKAGRIIYSSHNAAVHSKEGHFNYVTDADFKVQEYLKKELLSVLPSASFCAEEQENAALSDSYVFVVDPIDGTINFMRNRKCSVVSIALLEHKQPVLGVIYNPFTDEMYTAEKGNGSFCNGKRIHVSSVEIDNAIVSVGTSPYNAELSVKGMEIASKFLRSAGDLRRTGSAAQDLCDIASGRSDIYYELQLSPWDVAAGSLIVQEAGGVFISIGHDKPYFETVCGVLACNQVCRESAVRIMGL
ncbi:MAG: inositol monophosphatase [Sphaerochaetaceae bacterium]|nr:inositol monophosphatase [Sphaerochaetaceae bacterium]